MNRNTIYTEREMLWHIIGQLEAVLADKEESDAPDSADAEDAKEATEEQSTEGERVDAVFEIGIPDTQVVVTPPVTPTDAERLLFLSGTPAEAITFTAEEICSMPKEIWAKVCELGTLYVQSRAQDQARTYLKQRNTAERERDEARADLNLSAGRGAELTGQLQGARQRADKADAEIEQLKGTNIDVMDRRRELEQEVERLKIDHRRNINKAPQSG